MFLVKLLFHFYICIHIIYGYPGGSVGRNLPAKQETLFPSLGWEDTQQKEAATHYSLLAWEIPRTEEPGKLYSFGLQKSWTWLID